MATARGDWDLEKWALMVRWTRDRDGWRELERLALLEADGSRNDPRQILARLGLIAEPARQRDHPGIRMELRPPTTQSPRYSAPGDVSPGRSRGATPGPAGGLPRSLERSISWLATLLARRARPSPHGSGSGDEEAATGSLTGRGTQGRVIDE